MTTDLKSLRGSAAYVGAATYGCGEAPGHTDMELLAEAARRAVADAGLTMQDIDGLCTASGGATMWAMPVVEYLGIRPRYVDSTMIGGSSFIAHLLPAMQALASGQCTAVLVCYGSAQRTASFGRKEIVASRRFLDPQPYEMPYEPLLPLSAYALAASRHMHEFGTTRRDLAEVAVAARAWARLNPEAFVRDPLNIDDVLAARMVSDPLSVRDCCLVTDGGGAFVLVRAERAKDLPRTPVYVLGNGTAVWNRQISSMCDLTVTAAADSGRAAFAMAGLAPKDIGVVELYDAFTINVLLFLEDLGFCAKGEGGAFVQGGAIAPGGRLPVNTNGGGLSCVHPGMYGIFALIEAVRQLRGEGGERQVAGVNAALAHGNGGTLSSQSTAVLGLAETPVNVENTMATKIDLRDWIGREQTQEDRIGATPLAAFSATLDRDDGEPGHGDPLPPLWHWLFFLPRPLARELRADGHPTLGDFLPPVGLPRRMWAGSRLRFEHAPRVGEAVRRVSRIADVHEKTGASGRLVFVTVQHEIHTPRGLAITDLSDIVYRDVPPAAPQAPGSAPASADTPAAEFSRAITPDPVLLFRFSALTFNGHRIHYDQPYVTQVEGYPGLVVHGPLIAILLLDLLRRERPDADVRKFSFKAQRPIFDSQPFSVHGRADAAGRYSLWALDPTGQVAMQATAETT